jgi:hypothetical protein
LEDLDAEVEINSAWETIRENINISAKESLYYFEMKKHKPWFDEGCSKLLDQRKEAKLQWLQHQSEINGDNLNNVRREASRYFRNKEEEHLKDKINELATNSKNKNIRDLYKEINEIAKLKKYNSPGSDQIPAGGEMLLPAIHKLINSVWNKEELPDQSKESIIVPVHKKGDKTDCNNYRGYHWYQLHTKCYKISYSQG